MPLSKQQLGSLLWGIADTGLRGKVEDYKAYILSLLFFKRLSDNYEWETEKRIGQFRDQYSKEPNQKQLARLQEEGHAFVIPPKCFWQDVRDAKLEDKNERLHEAVNAITIIRRPVKHARLRVREDTSVQLIVPHSFDQSLIDRILQKKATWIARHQDYFRDRIADRRTLRSDEILLFDAVFQFVLAPELGRKVVVDDTAMEIRSGRDLTRRNEQIRWQRAHAGEFLRQRIGELSTLQRLPFNRLFIRSQRTKWGTCSAKGNISLNWRLILTPKHVIDYVILHELVHTKVLNHSHAFWVHLRALCPDAETAIHWLKRNRIVASPFPD